MVKLKTVVKVCKNTSVVVAGFAVAAAPALVVVSKVAHPKLLNGIMVNSGTSRQNVSTDNIRHRISPPRPISQAKANLNTSFSSVKTLSRGAAKFTDLGLSSNQNSLADSVVTATSSGQASEPAQGQLGGAGDMSSGTQVSTVNTTNPSNTPRSGQSSGAGIKTGSGETIHQNATISPYNFGINVATWDQQMRAASTPGTIDKLGAMNQQFPNSGAGWNWKTDRGRTPNNKGWDNYTEPLSLGGWGNLLKKTSTRGLFIVDYASNLSWTGPGTVQEVREVTHYILDHHMPVHAMVIGSEEYGNWGVAPIKDKSAARYARVAKQMAQAIHQIDPNMLVGVCMAPPNTGMHDQIWNQTVLQEDAPYIQFVSVHVYPITHQESNSGLLSSLKIIPTVQSEILQTIRKNAPHYANRIQTWVTEFNPQWQNATPQSVHNVYGAALAESLLLWRTAGAQQVYWWMLHGDATRMQGSYSTFGLASNGSSPEPSRVNQLFPSGTVYSKLMQAVKGGAKVSSWLSNDLFVSQITSSSKHTWVLVNNSTTPKTLSINGKDFAVAPTNLKFIYEQNGNFSTWELTGAQVSGQGISASIRSLSGGSFLVSSNEPEIDVSPLNPQPWTPTGKDPLPLPTIDTVVLGGHRVSVGANSPSGYPGQVVTLNGSNFGNTKGNGYIAFEDAGGSWGAPGNASTFRILKWTNDQIQFEIPTPSGPHGEWAVTVGSTATVRVFVQGGGISGVAHIRLNQPPKAHLTGLSPSRAVPGQILTLHGANFGSSQNHGYIEFGDNGINWGSPTNTAKLKVVQWSNQAIRFMVPLPSGNGYTWRVKPGTTASIKVVNGNGVSTNVLHVPVGNPPSPRIATVSVSSAGAGQKVTITGAGFGNQQTSGFVSFHDHGVNWGAPGNAAAFHIDKWSNISITFTVPTKSHNQYATFTVVPGTTAKITVTDASGGESNQALLRIH